MRRPRPGWVRPCGLALAGLGVVGLLGGCADQPSQEEFDAALGVFDSLPNEVKAYVCADDYYAVQYEVEAFVLVERCGSPTAEQIVRTQALSSAFESEQVTYAEEFYAQNPPIESDLDRVDVDKLCGEDEAAVRADIEQWREQTDFPSWRGVAFVPSVDGELARLRVWQQAACPLVQG